MDISILVALAPALASTFICVLAEGGPPLMRWLAPRARRFREWFRGDKPLLELVAETTTHLSTYGSALIIWVVHHLLGSDEPGYVVTAAVAVGWFSVMSYISYWTRRLLENLHKEGEQ